ncbi:MAG: ABC transporter permease [Rhizobiaceae bacterium]|nr:ABC transporter permease [Rhizobiaceae bacterium]
MSTAPANSHRLSALSRHILLLLVAYLILYAVLALTANNFLSPFNQFNILRQTSMIAIIAVGMTYVIIGAEIDLSVGALAAFSSICLAYMAVNLNLSLWLAIPATLAVGALSGCLIAFLRVKFRIPSFITSLALLTALRSGCFLISGGFPISPMPLGFTALDGTYVGPIRLPILIMVAVYFVGFIGLRHTPFGRSVYAVGGNEEAARLSGINVGAIKTAIFIISGVLSSFAGIMLASRLNSATPTVAEGWELDVIAAVIIGGTSLFGGRGSVIGTFLGVLFMTTLKSGMVLLGVQPYSQGLISGVVILIAVLAGAIEFRRR